MKKTSPSGGLVSVRGGWFDIGKGKAAFKLQAILKLMRVNHGARPPNGRGEQNILDIRGIHVNRRGTKETCFLEVALRTLILGQSSSGTRRHSLRI